jgi:hypothetical protein
MENVSSVLVATKNTKRVGFKINKRLGFSKLKWHAFSFEPYIGFSANGNMFGWGMLTMLLFGHLFFSSLVEAVHIILQVFKLLFFLVKRMVRPYASVSDFEFNKKLGHLIWC